MKIFDSHAHYDDERFNKDRVNIIESLYENGVQNVLNCGADLKTSKNSIELANKYDFIYAAVGVHPHDVKDLKDNDIKVIEDMTKEDKVVAIGEIGLDYHYDYSPRDIQRKWFIKQLDLANKLELPVIIHSREADQETFDIIKEHFNKENRGIIHCFSGSKELAKEYVKLGFYIGVGGVVTYKNARKLVEVVEAIDIDNIVIETDCPYLSPEPYRGKRNDSTNLDLVVRKISEIKEIDEEDIINITNKNAKNVFRI